METKKLKLQLSTIEEKLASVNKELLKYDDMGYKFLETESIGKLRRYGKDYYKDKFLKNNQGNVSSYMKSFLYLQHTEIQLKSIRTMLEQEKSKTEAIIKQYE
jgi:hypothetical protein